MARGAGTGPAVDLAAAIDTIRRWVEIESPTRDAAAVNRMLDAVLAAVVDTPLQAERIRGRGGYADTLILRTAPDSDATGILVLSHVDTVHPVGTLVESPFRRDGDRLYGPGLYDMKGGAYLALDALRTVARNARAGQAVTKLPVTQVFTPDEEVGSPTTRELIEALARRARYVLVTEPARDGGKVVTARKGVGRFTVSAVGVPAHSGGRHRDGRSAIKELAHQVLAVESMTDYARGITTTVGTISGGTAPNVIPQRAEMSVDLRVRDAATGEACAARILGLAPVIDGVSLTVTGGMNRPAFEKSPAIGALFAHAQRLARDIGFDLRDAPMAGGGSDGNFTAALGIPTLDGLGIDGDGAHTDWEYGLVSSIVPRTLLLRRLYETLG